MEKICVHPGLATVFTVERNTNGFYTAWTVRSYDSVTPEGKSVGVFAWSGEAEALADGGDGYWWQEA